uniref:Uncharacterized protein n=1 Tax=Davidia involucrata TaxID=16924 RepID=A0A5B6Z9Q8_DAVIN
MSTIAIHGPGIPRNSCYGTRIHHKFQRISASWTMKMNSNSSQTRKREELSIELQKHTIPQLETASHSSLQFDRLQPSEQELIQENRLEFGQFVSREAVLDEEFWQHGCEQRVSGRIERTNDMLITTKGNLQSRNLMH